MLLVERILFFLLVISPVIGLAMILSKGFSNTYNREGNDALYYSFWALVTIVGLFFDVLSFANAANGDYATGLLSSWNFLVELNGFLYFGYVIGCGWGFTTMNVKRETETISEVGKFLAKVVGATAGAFVLLVLFNTIAPIASQIN